MHGTGTSEIRVPSHGVDRPGLLKVETRRQLASEWRPPAEILAWPRGVIKPVTVAVVMISKPGVAMLPGSSGIRQNCKIAESRKSGEFRYGSVAGRVADPN
jgi:hypothetical protein